MFSYIRFGVLTVMKIQVVVFWVVTPCSDVADTLKIEAAWSFESLVYYHIATQCQNPDDHDLMLSSVCSIKNMAIRAINICYNY
jgi:hypothetical protein